MNMASLLRLLEGSTEAARYLARYGRHTEHQVKLALAETVAHMEAQPKVLTSQGAGFIVVRNLEDPGYRVWVDPTVEDVRPGALHLAVLAGDIGRKTLYIDVPREEALRRWAENEEALLGAPPPDAPVVDEWRFTDEVQVYEAWAPKS